MIMKREMNNFTPKDSILSAMSKHFPIAAIDVETSKYY